MKLTWRVFSMGMMLIVLGAVAALPTWGQAACDPAVDYLPLANDHYSAGDYQAAVDSFTCAVAQHPSSAATYNGRGNAYRNLGDFAAAIADYTQAVQLEPEFALAYSNRGWAYYQLGQMELALADLNHAIDLDSSLAFAYNNRGLVYQALGQHDLAIDDFNTAIQLGHEPPEWPMYNLEQAQLEQAQLGAAPSPTTTPSGTPTLDELIAIADAAYSDRDWEAVIDAYGQVVAMDPTYARGYFQRAYAYDKLEQYELGIENYTLALENDYAFPYIAYNNRGWAYYQLDQYELALEDYNRALEDRPTYGLAYYNRALAHSALDEYELAIADAEAALENGYSSPRSVYNNLGYYHSQLDDKDKAIEYYMLAIDTDPNYALPQRNLGYVYRDMGEYALAIDYFTRALELEPDRELTYLARGMSYLGNGQPVQAAQDFNTRFTMIVTDRRSGDTLLRNQPVSLEMAEGRLYELLFDGETGQMVSVTVTSPTVDSLIVILSPDNEPITANDDISEDTLDSAILNYELPATGTYTLLVGHAGGRSDGTVDVLLEGTVSASDLIDRGKRFVEDGDNAAALFYYDAAIATEPDNALAYYERGDLYYAMDNLDAALADIDQVLEIDDTYVAAYHYRGVIYENLGDYEAALTSYNHALELDPGYVLSYFGRGNAYQGMGQNRQAIAAYDSVLALDPEYVGAYHNRGLSYAAVGDYEKAIADYNIAMELDPSYDFLVHDRADVYLDMGDFDNALADYDAALALDPNDSGAYLGRGITFIGLDDRMQAGKDFLTWFDLIQTDPITYTPILEGELITLEMAEGRVYRIPFQGETGQIATFRADSENVDSLLVLLDPDGNVLTADDDGASGMNALIEGFELPVAGEYTLVLGHAGGESYGNIDLIFGVGQTVSELLSRGDNSRRADDFTAAIADYTVALQLDPTNAHAYFFRGYSYGELGQHENAIADYSQAIEYGYDPANYAYNNRGWSYSKLGDYDQAIVDYNAAIALDPDYALALYNRGWAYAQIGEHELAIADYTQALEFDAGNGRLWFNRAFSYGELGEYELANQDYLSALANNYENPHFAYYNRGWVFRQLDDYEQSLIEYTKAIEFEPDYARAFYGRGYTYYLMGEYDEALDDYDQALALNYEDPSEIYADRADLYKATGDWQAAIDDYTTILAINPDDTDVYLRRGIAEINLGDRLTAANDFMTWLAANESERIDHDAINKGDALSLDMVDGRVYAIPFTVEAGDSVSFVAVSADVDPLLVILDADGQPLTADDDSGGDLNALIDSYIAPADGTYTLLVSHADAGVEGTIDLAFNGALTASQLETRGNTYRDAGEYELAIADYTALLELDPTNAAIYFERGYSYGEVADYEQAIADYTDAIRLGFQPVEWAYYNRGWAYRELDDYAMALPNFNRALVINPDYALGYWGRGDTHYLMGDLTHAVADYTQAIDLGYSDAASIYGDRALAYLDMEDWDAAVADYSETLLTYPDDIDAHLERGIAYIGLGDSAAAGADFAQYLDLIETDRVGGETLLLGTMMPMPSEFSVEMTEGRVYAFPFEIADDQVVNFSAVSDSVDSLIVILDADGHPIAGDDDSGGHLDAAIGELELSAGTYTLLIGHAGQGSEGGITVMIAFAQALEELKNEANGYMVAGEYQKAVEAWTGVLARAPEDVESLYGRATSYMALSVYALAISDYSRVIALGFEPPEQVITNRGTAYMNMNAYDDAIGDFEAAIDLNPAYSDAYLYLGWTYTLQGDSEETLAVFEQAVENEAADTAIYCLRGSMYFQMGEMDLAEADFAAAIPLSEQNACAYVGRGYIRLGRGDITEAGEDYMALFLGRQTSRIADLHLGLDNSLRLQMTQGRVYVISIDLDEPATVMIQVTSDSADPAFVLVDADNAIVAVDDDSGGDLNALVSDLELEAGSYKLFISHAGGGSEGNIDVSITEIIQEEEV